MNKRLGIIQSRGLGDIIIALPIAKFYQRQGWDIYWPICEEFWGSVRDTAPWVNWMPIPEDKMGHYFYDEPMKRLRNVGCNEVICLYQSLNVVPELSQVPWFQIQHFDEFKYTKSGVPFLEKWNLAECIIRNSTREQALKSRVVKKEQYYVTHLTGSNFKAMPDLSQIPEDWQRIDVDDNITDCIFDWIDVISDAQALICVDSALSNMVDQLKIEVDRYWIPRSHIHLTPVLGTSWTILDPPPNSLASQRIFASAPAPT